MSKRIVDDPSLHGWVDDNGKWVWGNSGGSGISGDGTGAGMIISETEPTDKVEGMQWLNPTTGLVLFWDDEKWLQMPGGVNGADGSGNIADGSTDGIVATWDDTAKQWTPESAVVVKGGRLGIGTDSPNRTLTVNNTTGSIVAAQYNRDNSNGGEPKNIIYHYSADGVGRLVYAVDNAGTENYIQSSQDFRLIADAGSSLKFDTNGNNTRLTIDASGDATFTGNVTAKDYIVGQNIYRSASGAGGLKITTLTSIIPTDNTGTNTDGELNLGAGSNRFKTVFGTIARMDRVIQDGSPVIDAKGLIKTLSTLRNATKDETTLEGLRDSIGNAIGGLIEEFENQIATMPAEDES